MSHIRTSVIGLLPFLALLAIPGPCAAQGVASIRRAEGAPSLDRDTALARVERAEALRARTAERQRATKELSNEPERPTKAVSLSLSNDFWYYTAYGSTQFVMGEVTNTGGSIPSFVKISMEFLDSSDRVLASDWTYVTGSCRTLNASDIETDTCLVGGETGFFGEYVDVNMAQVAKVRYSFDWFFKESNWEMLVKVLDGCGLNGSYWVFAAATTNVEYRLFITDTRTGDTRTYFNEQGTYSPAIIDTHAFPGCQ